MSDKDIRKGDRDAGEWIESKAARRRAKKLAAIASSAPVTTGQKKKKSFHYSSSMWRNYDWARSQCSGTQKSAITGGNHVYSPVEETAQNIYEHLEKRVSQQEAKRTESTSNNLVDRNTSGQDNERYKTEFCRSYSEYGKCRYGEKCLFAHGLQELRVRDRPHKYKTERCQSWWATDAKNNPLRVCGYADRCRFIHDETSEQLKAIRKTKLASDVDNQSESKRSPSRGRRAKKKKKSKDSTLTCSDTVSVVPGDVPRSATFAFPVHTNAIEKNNDDDDADVKTQEDALLEDVWMALLSSQTDCETDNYDEDDRFCCSKTVENEPHVSEQERERHLRRLDIFDTLTATNSDRSSYFAGSSCS